MNELATQQRHPLVEFKQQLDGIHKAGELALPDTVPFKNFKNAAVVALTDNPDLVRCDRGSLFKALRMLAATGLVPDGREAAVVAYGGKAQALPMVTGIIKVARNSGKIVSLWADVVYEGETLEVWVEDGERKWSHVKEDGSKIDAMTRGGEIRGAYAVAKLADGTVEFQPMSKQEIEKRRRASSNQRGDNPTGVWASWYSEMALKTVIRNLAKRLPMSAEDLDRIMREDEANEVRIRDVTPQDETAAPRRMSVAQRLQAKDEPQQEVLPPESAQEPANDDDVPMMDGEVMDLSGAFPGAPEWDEGVKAFQAGKHWTECPYDTADDAGLHWMGGWKGACDAAEGGE